MAGPKARTGAGIVSGLQWPRDAAQARKSLARYAGAGGLSGHKMSAHTHWPTGCQPALARQHRQVPRRLADGQGIADPAIGVWLRRAPRASHAQINGLLTPQSYPPAGKKQTRRHTQSTEAISPGNAQTP